MLVFMLLCTLLVRSGNSESPIISYNSIIIINTNFADSSKPNKKKISLLEITLKIFTDIPFLVLG